MSGCVVCTWIIFPCVGSYNCSGNYFSLKCINKLSEATHFHITHFDWSTIVIYIFKKQYKLYLLHEITFVCFTLNYVHEIYLTEQTMIKSHYLQYNYKNVYTIWNRREKELKTVGQLIRAATKPCPWTASLRYDSIS